MTDKTDLTEALQTLARSILNLDTRLDNAVTRQKAMLGDIAKLTLRVNDLNTSSNADGESISALKKEVDGLTEGQKSASAAVNEGFHGIWGKARELNSRIEAHENALQFVGLGSKQPTQPPVNRTVEATNERLRFELATAMLILRDAEKHMDDDARANRINAFLARMHKEGHRREGTT